MKTSLIIPCYNEAKNLPLLISRCQEFVEDLKNIEIVIVDNGSIDNTSSILKILIANLSYIKVVRIENNQGYGHGILTGLNAATGDILSWTHADMQTDPADLLKGMKLFEATGHPEQLFVKGKRRNRPIADALFTIGMALFETLLLRKVMWDINAQPTMFHRNFFSSWNNPPDDFLLDLLPKEIAGYVDTSSHWNFLGWAWDQKVLNEAQDYANHNRGVIAVLPYTPLGHVALILPGEEEAILFLFFPRQC